MKPIAVLDSTVVISGIGWAGGDPRAILHLLAKRRLISARTASLTFEWQQTLSRLSQRPKWQNHNWAAWLDWLCAASVLVEAVPLKPTIKRDPKDDHVLAAALGARADFLVSYDKDILELGKPFGIHCVRPLPFVRAIIGA